MSATSSLELLKAHAVISRSWLLAQIEQRHKQQTGSGGSGFFSFIRKDDELIKWYDREDHTIFDVCADDHCQRYQGITKATSKHVAEAIRATRGQILMSGDEICDARFSKCCGGATANTLAAYMAGAQCLSTTVNGLGERAGNAAMEEVAMALELSAGTATGLKTEKLQEISTFVAAVSKRTLSDSKPITGKMVLTHESGIHTNCLMKDRSSYQLIDAAKIGRKEDDFVIGKHSGRSTLELFLKEANLPFDDELCIQLLAEVKEKSENEKRSITKEELYDLYSRSFSKANNAAKTNFEQMMRR
jgi:SpoIID/LytB domain protein